MTCLDAPNRSVTPGLAGRPVWRMAEVAAECGYGDVEDLDGFYASLPADYEGNLPLRELALVDQFDAEAGNGSNG